MHKGESNTRFPLNPSAFTVFAGALFMSRLTNGTSTSVSIQNVSVSTIAAGGGSPIGIGPFTVPGQTVLIRNHRLTTGPQAETALPDGWVGSLQVTADRFN